MNESAAADARERITTPMGRRLQYSPRQTQILDQLEILFLARGFRATTIDDIAREVHCSLGTLYKLAPTKEELFLLVLDRMWARVGETARSAMLEVDDPSERITVFVHKGAQIFRPPWGAFVDDIQSYAPARRLFDDHFRMGTDFLAASIEAGIDQGAFRPCNAAFVARALAALALRVTSGDFLDEIGMDAGDAEHSLVELLLKGIETRA